ncbi:hypothetical protein [Mycobacterium paraffinicum]|nr:hypothetical protein [Mycobacterium paraffinicum]
MDGIDGSPTTARIGRKVVTPAAIASDDNVEKACADEHIEGGS